MHRAQALIGLLLASTVSCTRVARRAPECPPDSPLPELEVSVRGPVADARLRGRIVDRHTGDPVPGALVTIAGPSGPDSLLASEAGRYELRIPVGGTAVIETRSLGFRVRVDTLALRPARELDALFPMEYAALDGCGFGVVVEKEPWWKIW